MRSAWRPQKAEGAQRSEEPFEAWMYAVGKMVVDRRGESKEN